MTGKVEPIQAKHTTQYTSPRSMPRCYFAIDGGGGAHLLAALAIQTPFLQPVASPRHANLLIVCGPITCKLLPALAAVARSLPGPAYALILDGGAHGMMPLQGIDPLSGGHPFHSLLDENSVLPGEFFPGARTNEPHSVRDVLAAIFAGDPWPELVVRDIPETKPDVIHLPPKHEKELATEPIVLSLGPIQPFTAGPLRLVLVCDGEQVLSAQVEAGYAHRGIAEAMMRATWQDGLALARLLDPLAPIAGQLAYTRAIEQLRGWTPPAFLVTLREAALALERAQNALWWAVTFARVLDDQRLLRRFSSLASRCAATIDEFWQQSPLVLIAPQREIGFAVVEQFASLSPRLRAIAGEVDTSTKQVERNRFLSLRTRGIGAIDAEQLMQAGVSGPVLQASKEGEGDVQSRLVTRLHMAAEDIRAAIDSLATGGAGQAQLPAAHEAAQWTIPAGESHVVVEGPRGVLGLHLRSDGGTHPAHVAWQRPSAPLLSLVPELLRGQKLADAETIVASLDLAMAEADG